MAKATVCMGALQHHIHAHEHQLKMSQTYIINIYRPLHSFTRSTIKRLHLDVIDSSILYFKTGLMHAWTQSQTPVSVMVAVRRGDPGVATLSY